MGAILAGSPGVDVELKRAAELPPCALDNDVMVLVSSRLSGWAPCRLPLVPAHSPFHPCPPPTHCLQLRGERHGLMAAVEVLSHVLREHPVLERPGGAPPALRALMPGGGVHAAPPVRAY